MSNLYRPADDYDNWWTLGSTVEFDYHGTRLTGEIVRVYAAGTSFHVEVDGRRYEADIHADNMSMVW